MPQIEISKIKLRRGSNAQRKQVIFDQGEIVSTTDTKRVFIGTGSLSGGFPVASKVHPPLLNYYSLSSTDAEIGDLVNANNKFYQLIASDYTDISNWQDVSTVIDTVPFSYSDDNTLTLNPSSISAIYINPNSVSNGLYISNGVLQTNINTKCLEISALKLSVKASGIDEREINSAALSSGLTGGSGSKILLDIDTDHFHFVSNKLTLSSEPLLPLVPSPAGEYVDGIKEMTVNNYGQVTEVIPVTLLDDPKLVTRIQYINNPAGLIRQDFPLSAGWTQIDFSPVGGGASLVEVGAKTATLFLNLKSNLSAYNTYIRASREPLSASLGPKLYDPAGHRCIAVEGSVKIGVQCNIAIGNVGNSGTGTPIVYLKDTGNYAVNFGATLWDISVESYGY